LVADFLTLQNIGNFIDRIFTDFWDARHLTTRRNYCFQKQALYSSTKSDESSSSPTAFGVSRPKAHRPHRVVLLEWVILEKLRSTGAFAPSTYGYGLNPYGTLTLLAELSGLNLG
jgi:hypothetical protein